MRSWRLVIVAALLAGSPVSPVAAQVAGEKSAGETDWLSGDEFIRRLNAPVGVNWQSNPLREALAGLARQQRTAIFLDRRIDPDQRIDYASGGERPYREVLQQIAAEVDAAVGTVGPVIYLGPTETARELATLCLIQEQRLKQFANPAQQRLTTRRPWSWPALDEPRQLLEQRAEEYQVNIDNLTDVPHDLWPGYQLPTLTFVESLTLVLAGFQATFQWDDARRVRLVPFPTEPLFVEQTYQVPRQQSKLRTALAEFPNATAEWQANGLHIRGRWEDHQGILAALSNDTQRSQGRGGTTVFTLTLKNQPVGAVLKTIENQTKFRFDIDPTAVNSLGHRVSFSIKEQALDVLLQKTLEPAGLAYEIRDKVIRIRAK